jgi:N-acetylglucosaminyldiphosphoundecaprenol N-acetyl-beta-D-mannosaminyltransferase
MANLQRTHILGVPIDIVSLSSAVPIVMSWLGEKKPKIVFFRDVASLMLASENVELLRRHFDADLVCPDGMPLVWLGKYRGFGNKIGRTYGPDMLEELCKATQSTEHSHYFYGGKTGVAKLLIENLRLRYPNLKIAGYFSPPMRAIDNNFELSEECMIEIEAIKAVKPDFVWVGISSPKQEYWISKVAPHFEKSIFLGVGAAFDFHSGTVKQAPLWMQRNGLEWLHRLYSEPKRLWRRYLILAPLFLIKLTFTSATLK